MNQTAIDASSRHCKASYSSCSFEPETVKRSVTDDSVLIVHRRTIVDIATLATAFAPQIVECLDFDLDTIGTRLYAVHKIQVVTAERESDQSAIVYTLATMLILLRSGYNNTNAVIANTCSHQTPISHQMCYKTLDLVGRGAVAGALRAARLSGIVCNVFARELFAVSVEVWLFTLATVACRARAGAN